MLWNKNNYPVSMKNLDDEVRTKAVEIANALLEEDYEEGRAIPIAIAQAKKWAENKQDDDRSEKANKNGDGDLHVIPHPRGWAIRRSTAERSSFVFPTKAEAVAKGRTMAHNSDVRLIVHNADDEARSTV